MAATGRWRPHTELILSSCRDGCVVRRGATPTPDADGEGHHRWTLPQVGRGRISTVLLAWMRGRRPAWPVILIGKCVMTCSIWPTTLGQQHQYVAGYNLTCLLYTSPSPRD